MVQIKDNTVQVVFISLLLDLLAFTMILPLLPALLDYYKEIEDDRGIYFKILYYIQNVRTFFDAPDKVNTVLYGGFLGSMYSFLQFLSSPIVGALSDVYGRKPLMIFCLTGIALSYLLWALSCNFTIFVLARFVGGISKGNINLSMAIISDVTSPKTRGKAMALVGIAFSVGFVIGPMIGAFFSWVFSDNRKETWHIIPAVFAFFLTTSDLFFIICYLKESLPLNRRTNTFISSVIGIFTYINPIDLFQFNGVSDLNLQDKKNLRTLGSAYFIYLFVYSGLEFTLTFLTHYLFKFTSMQQGWMFLGIGLVMAILQGSWVRTIPPNKTKSVAELGLWLIIPAFICLGFANDILTLSIGLFLFAISTAMVVTCMMTLVTRIGPDHQKGTITGVFRSLGALARACGPIVASSGKEFLILITIKMSLWAKAQQLPQDALQEVRSVYGEHFPIEVRHFLSSWIEEKMWTDIEPDNPQYEQYIATLVRSLIQELETKAASLNTDDMFLTKLKLMEAAKNFRQRYTHNPTALFRIIRHCLGTEMKLVAQVENLGGALMSMAGGKVGLISDAVAEIAQHVESLRRRTQETGEDLRKMEQEQEAFAISYHECTKLNAHLQHLATQPQNQQNLDMEKKIRRQKEQQEQLLNHKVAGLMQLRLTLADKLKDTITRLNSLQSRVLDDELIRWKRDQQLAGNGAPFNSNLDSIQEWCESLAELIWLNRQQIKEAERLKQKFALEPPGMQDILPALNSQITQLLSSLVTSTFIIEKQPPQVMKTNTRFTSTVRLLVGGKLNVHMTPPQVKVSIISEAQANALLKSDKMAKNGEASGEILNNTGTMEYHQATRQLSVSFRNMQLKKIKRAEKKGTESVMDEKFSLLFQSQFSVGGGELVFQVWTLSLPVVVIVHGNQEPHAWATVTWDNAFAEPGRVPFAVPDKVPWSQVAEALNVKFRSATGRSLTEDNLRFLAEKAFRGGNASGQDYSSLFLSWAQFCKEPLPERNFTFWEWFYAVMKLTREHLKNPWMDGYILGFVRKRQAEEMLANCASGTFLMRFSDSELGGVTIAWVGDQTEVFMLQPFTSKDFTIRSLADRVSDLQHLLYLYPDISKDQAFSKYYTPFTENQSTSANGYVKPFLVTHVPGWGGPGIGGQTPSHSSVVGVGSNGQSGPGSSYPATPSTIFQAHSPDPSVTRDTPSVASSYAPGLGQSSVGRNPDMDYVELMSHGELPSIDENLNLDQFSFSEFIQSYNTKPQ